MGGHHLILGELKDFITGEILEDSHDERYRQKIARMLVLEKGYEKTDIEQRQSIKIKAGKNQAVIKIDFLIFSDKKIAMIIRYAPGSLVSRQRPVLASSRIIMPYQIPVVVVTNGEEINIMDGTTGKITAKGPIDVIPSKSELFEKIKDMDFKPISEKRIEQEQRIIYAYEINDACPCDETICKL
ncbi:Type I restriction enzyme R protein N-terminal domain-containing protein [Candidatus Magnetomoraceae bacterium gMMP-15]